MTNKAKINASPAEKALRSLARCERLKESITKAESNGKTERAASLKAEFDGRMRELRELKSRLAVIDAD